MPSSSYRWPLSHVLGDDEQIESRQARRATHPSNERMPMNGA